MRVLVTGGAGFIGSHIADLLIKEGHKVAVIDDLSHGKRENVNKKAVFFKEDICNSSIKTIFNSFRPEAVSHQAALVNVTQSLQEPLKDVSVNVGGTLQILEAAKVCKTKQIIFASSAAVYGDPEKIPTKENQPIKPISIYGASKTTAEYYLNLYGDSFIPTILRYANVYGPRQDSSAEGGVVAIFVNNLAKNKKSQIYGSGRQSRDFIYAVDVARANLLAIKTKRPGIFNIATGKGTSIIKLYNLLSEILKSRIKPVFKKKRPGDIYKSILTNSKAGKSLAWQPQVSLKQGLVGSLNWLK